jgi:PAS domain S-box-containing protein
VPASIFYKDKENRFIRVNKACTEFLGKPKEELEGKSCFEIFPRDHAEDFWRDDKAVMASEHAKRNIIEPVEILKGTMWVRTDKIPYRDEKGNIMGVIGFAVDITERKRAEEQVKASLSEKEVLLREIHHRVKNNLQVVSSLLSMQARAAKDKDAIDMLSESRNRINAMALIHTQLYESRDLSEITMKGFVDKLLRQLLQSYPVHDTKITPTIHVVDYPFPISMAVPVGLIVNELLSNALKHAFVNRKEGKIEVGLSASEKGKITLTVSDDGVGLPDGFDITATRTLGLRMVKILAEDQLQGNLEVISKEGMTFKIEFDIENRGGG